MGADIPVLGIGVRAPKEKQEASVLKLARETAMLLGRPDAVTDAMVVADCDYVGAGYGLIDQGVVDALTLAARTDAILLDPVYTGKAMKGLIALARAGRFTSASGGETMVFLHTGGAQGLAGYQGELDAML
jgi:L-cysteate sulfo-lyase